MTDIPYKNMLFDRAIDSVKRACDEITTCTHLFDRTRRYDTALDKLDLRLCANELRVCAELIERIERRLQGTKTAFPERKLEVVK